jgi:ribosome-associated protein
MLNSLADAVNEKVRADFHIHSKLEGKSDAGWVVLDLGDIVVHLFSPEQREYYNLEELWEGGKILVRLD